MKKKRLTAIRDAIDRGVKQGLYLDKSFEDKILASIQGTSTNKITRYGYRISERRHVYIITSTEQITYISFDNVSKRIVPLESTLFV